MDDLTIEDLVGVDLKVQLSLSITAKPHVELGTFGSLTTVNGHKLKATSMTLLTLTCGDLSEARCIIDLALERINALDGYSPDPSYHVKLRNNNAFTQQNRPLSFAHLASKTSNILIGRSHRTPHKCTYMSEVLCSLASMLIC